ncbi:hypothetical protein BIT28_24230 [Photobacterium proteolyticum]|uniref:Uncharacterized protein n=1 Tax=Photobacterium proteolyticum TaxID=1903952 RepID=A0A1Q9GCL7_9GAMM|nr:hypothetical protein BIT28_24230 [Photobacterium proteolyticum]
MRLIPLPHSSVSLGQPQNKPFNLHHFASLEININEQTENEKYFSTNEINFKYKHFFEKSEEIRGLRLFFEQDHKNNYYLQFNNLSSKSSLKNIYHNLSKVTFLRKRRFRRWRD